MQPRGRSQIRSCRRSSRGGGEQPLQRGGGATAVATRSAVLVIVAESAAAHGTVTASSRVALGSEAETEQESSQHAIGAVTTGSLRSGREQHATAAGVTPEAVMTKAAHSAMTLRNTARSTYERAVRTVVARRTARSDVRHKAM